MAVRRTLAPLCALLLLLVVGASGCAEDKPEVKIAPSASPTPTAAASASPTVAAETPEQFIKRWAELEKEMLNTGDTAKYAAITGPCESCGKLITNVETYYAAGGYVKWDGYTIRKIRSVGGNKFRVWVSSAPTTYKRSADAQEEGFPGGKSLYLLTLNRREAGLELANFLELEL